MKGIYLPKEDGSLKEEYQLNGSHERQPQVNGGHGARKQGGTLLQNLSVLLPRNDKFGHGVDDGQTLILRSSIFDFVAEDLNTRGKPRQYNRKERSHNAKTISVTPPISGPSISNRKDLNISVELQSPFSILPTWPSLG